MQTIMRQPASTLNSMIVEYTMAALFEEYKVMMHRRGLLVVHSNVKCGTTLCPAIAYTTCPWLARIQVAFAFSLKHTYPVKRTNSKSNHASRSPQTAPCSSFSSLRLHRSPTLTFFPIRPILLLAPSSFFSLPPFFLSSPSSSLL